MEGGGIGSDSQIRNQRRTIRGGRHAKQGDEVGYSPRKRTKGRAR